jgi:peptide-methionine (R)-S-oxide reductase
VLKASNGRYVLEVPLSERAEKVVRTEAEWRALLTPEQYRILREKATERPFTGALTENHETGNFHCAGCGALLFQSGAKFDSGCGWPSFMLPADSKAVVEDEDMSHGMRRVEVTCAGCGGHLGHVFPDGPRPTGLRYCINSASLTFKRVK